MCHALNDRDGHRPRQWREQAAAGAGEPGPDKRRVYEPAAVAAHLSDGFHHLEETQRVRADLNGCPALVQFQST